MKPKKIILSLLFLSNFLFSQFNCGSITYKLLDVKRNDGGDSTYVNTKSIDFSKTLNFKLNFDKKRANFYTVSNLSLKGNVEDNLLNISTVKGFYSTDFDSSKVYRFVEYEELGGKIAVENTNQIKWKLLNKKKVISGYECYLAEGVFKIYDRYVTECNLTAWYCPKIPIAIGPKFYNGLPGLIMEITDNKVTFGVTEMNFDDQLITKPVLKEIEYKKITDKEYTVMVAEFIDSMIKK